jgi:2-amino-4-hydroxy-6-hydroxymethyldihydropteridine diphosphokinase
LQHSTRSPRRPGIELERRSSLYRTAPIGYDNQPDFINAVARVRTTLAPQALLDQLLNIERMHGRIREFLNAPRTLDLDVLLYDDEQIRTDTLNVPAPARASARLRAASVARGVTRTGTIPGIGAASAWLAHCQDQPISRIADAMTIRLAVGSVVPPARIGLMPPHGSALKPALLLPEIPGLETLTEDPLRPDQRRERLGIGEFALPYGGHRSLERQRGEFEELTIIELRADMAQAAGEKDFDVLVGVADAGMHRAEMNPLVGFVPGFLAQFAHRRRCRRFAGIDLSRGKFKEGTARTVPVLPFEQHVAIGQYGDDDDRTGVAYIFAHGLPAVGQPHLVLKHLQQNTVVDLPAVEGRFDQMVGHRKTITSMSGQARMRTVQEAAEASARARQSPVR